MDKAKKNKDVAATNAAEQPVATSAAPSSPEAKRKPLSTIRVDDCSASIWARERLVQGKPKVFFSMTLQRCYKDRDGAWRYTQSFDSESLGRIVALCEKATQAIDELQNQAAGVET